MIRRFLLLRIRSSVALGSKVRVSQKIKIPAPVSCVCSWLYKHSSEKWGRRRRQKGGLRTYPAAPHPAVSVHDLSGRRHLPQPGDSGHLDVTMGS